MRQSPIRQTLLRQVLRLSATRFGGWFFTTITPPLDRFLMRKTQGRWNLGLGWVPIGLLETTGRRTGRTYQTPLLYDAFDSYLYLVASSGGSPKHPTWYWNAKDRPVVFYRGGQVLRGHMEETDGQDYADAWNRFRAFNPGFDTYNERVDRHIPILRMKI